MTLSKEEKRALVTYRMQKAYNTLTEAEDNAKSGHWTLAANRLYYALYYAASALLLSQGFIAHTHAGVIRIIGLEFVVKGILTKEDGRLFSRLFEMRQGGDYDDFLEWTEEDVAPYFEKVVVLIRKLEGLIVI